MRNYSNILIQQSTNLKRFSYISTNRRLSDLQEVIANEHYGHNGGPEIGAWINKRLYSVENP